MATDDSNSTSYIDGLRASLAKAEKERDFYRDILDQLHYTSVLAINTDPLAQVEFANKFFCDFNGVTYEKAITMKAYEFASTPDDDVQKVNEAIGRVLGGGEPVLIHSYFRSRGAKHATWGLMIVQRLDRPSSNPYVLFTTIAIPELGIILERTNITADRMRAITTAINDAVILLDEDGGVTHWNLAAEKMFGVMANDAIDRNLAEFALPARVRETFRLRITPPKDLDKPSFGANVFESVAIHNDGTEFPVDISVAPVRLDNGQWGFVCFFRDITDRKRAEEALLKTKSELEEANKLKDQFVALVSHDLRSPLSSIHDGLEIALSRVNDATDPQSSQIIRRSCDNLKGLLVMIERLLDINRLKTGKIKPNKVFNNAREMTSQVFHRLGSLAEEKKIRLVNDVPAGIRLFADNTLFFQTIQNLVLNSIKFCREGDIVTVHIRPEAPNTLVVEDTGVGIAENMISNLFKPEVHTSTPGTRGEKGSGLGLPLCHNIMKAHGGDLRVESAIGKGTMFYCELPPARPIVLVVDDQRVVRDEIASHLVDMGVEIVEAENGKDALMKMAGAWTCPHLVITDLAMPVMSGFKLLDTIKSQPGTRNIPVIVMTSSEDTVELRDDVFRRGAADFVRKPLLANDFVPRVRRFVGA